MIHNSKPAIKILSIVLLFTAIVLAGCQQSDSEDQTSAPEIPPKFSMTITEEFPSQNSAQALQDPTADAITAQTINNFIYAAGNVGVWNTILVVNLVVPVTAFYESFHHFPSLRSDGTWVWSYAVDIGNIIHTVELHAKAIDNDIHWDMYVTKPGHYLDFKWFSGVSAKDHSGGYWTLRKNPEEPMDYLEIEWTKDVRTNTGSARYTNVEIEGSENGSYVFYGVTTEQSYDAFYDIYLTSRDELVEIEWNRTSKAGRVQNPAYFQDQNWHYWNENLQDIPAP